MDIEETQKINALAHELLKHRIASSSEEAVETAARMLHKGNAKEELSPLDVGKADRPVSAPQEAATGSQVSAGQSASRDIGYIDNKVSNMQMQFSALKSQLDKQAEAVNAVRQQLMMELSTLRQKIERMESGSQRTLQQSQASSAPAEQAKAEPRSVSAGVASKGFTEADVSVEKIFYFGK